MARLTRSEIVQLLLSGAAVPWLDVNKKKLSLELADAKQRRLFAFLVDSIVRKPVELSSDFVTALSAAYEATDDPAANQLSSSEKALSGPWRLQSIETEGFGGLNTWQGGLFRLDFDQESLLLEGPNGSGKSSLAGAIVWALTGERPRDQTSGLPHEPRPVFSADDKPAGDWPPIACYPDSVPNLRLDPKVRVRLSLVTPGGLSASVERSLCAGRVSAVALKKRGLSGGEIFLFVAVGTVCIAIAMFGILAWGFSGFG
jgi:hypothetical protein